MEPVEEVVQETEEVSPAPEGEKTDEATETPAKEEAEKPNYYSPEEIEELLANDGTLDATRLSPEGRLLQKSFQRGFNPKLEERAALKRRLDELEKKVTTAPAPAPRTIEEAYEKDPMGTLSYIDGEINKHRARIDEDPLGAIKEIENLRSVREHLRDTDHFKAQKREETNSLTGEVYAAVRSEIPDFDKKQAKLNDFAINELGYSQEEIRSLSDPMRVGRSAAKFVSTINRMYDLQNASKTVKEKEVKVVPKTERAGDGVADNASATYAVAMKKAIASGDFSKVLELKGVLKKITPE